MKQLIHRIVVSIIVVGLSACASSPIQDCTGEYDFKVSGHVTKDAAQIIVLPNETGTMEMTHLSDSTYMLTFNTINGCAYTTQATVSGNQVEMNPFIRTIELSFKKQESNILGIPIEIIQTEVYNTEVYGFGTIYGDIIHFNLQYLGTEFVGNKTIKGSDILMIANKK
jgi:hypothetical protein